MVLLAILLVVASVVIGRIAVGQETKIIIDLGLSALTIFGALIAILLGIGLVSKTSRTAPSPKYPLEPVRRSELILSKYFGLCLTLLVSSAATAAAIALALLYAQAAAQPSCDNMALGLADLS